MTEDDAVHRAAGEALLTAHQVLDAAGVGAERVVVLIDAADGETTVAMSQAPGRPETDAQALLAALVAHTKHVADAAGLALDLFTVPVRDRG